MSSRREFACSDTVFARGFQPDVFTRRAINVILTRFFFLFLFDRRRIGIVIITNNADSSVRIETNVKRLDGFSPVNFGRKD